MAIPEGIQGISCFAQAYIQVTIHIRMNHVIASRVLSRVEFE